MLYKFIAISKDFNLHLHAKTSKYMPGNNIMIKIAFILMGAGMLITVIILGTGLFAMMRGGEFNKKYSNKLMRARIIAQSFAIIMFVIGGYLAKGQ